MLVKALIAILILFFSIVWCIGYVYAQDLTVSCVFERDTLIIKPGSTFSNKLVVKNHTIDEVFLTIESTGKSSNKALIALPDTIRLGPGEEKRFPVKYIVDKQTIVENLQRFEVRLNALDQEMEALPNASFYTQLADTRTLTLQTEQPVYFLQPSTNQTQLMLNCVNNGLIPISFRLVLSEVPEGLEFMGEQMSLTLPAGARQLIPFIARNKTNSRQTADFSVTIQAVDASGQQLAVHRVRIQHVNSVSSFFSNAPFAQTPNNTAAFRYLSLNQYNEIYQMQANGQLTMTNKHELDYRLNLDYYQQLGGVNLYDTYLSYENQNWGLKLGNIYENLDYALSGRGARASYLINEVDRVSVYALQNNYMLASQIFNDLPNENILAANYSFLKNGQEGRLTYLHSHQSFNALNSHQVSVAVPLKLGAQHDLKIEAGYSQETFTDIASTRRAVAGGIDYSITYKEYQFSTNNYYSSPYFTGLRRGILQSDSRIIKSTEDGGTYSLRISLLNNRPSYQGRRYRYGYLPFQNSIYSYEIGYGKNLGRFRLEMKPYLMQQSLRNGTYSSEGEAPSRWRSSAGRMLLNVSYTAPIHSFYLHVDHGYVYESTMPMAPSSYHSLRINGSYTNPLFGISTYIQINPYYLSDLFANVNDAAYRLYSIGPNTNFTAFKNKLQVQLAAMYNYYGFTDTRNYSVNGTARWNLKGNWAVTGDMFYTLVTMQTTLPAEVGLNYVRSSFDTRQIRIGIEKQFAAMQTSNGKRIRLIYYQDLNNNGNRDEGESYISGLMVKINDQTAVTDKSGQAEFQHMPVGNYIVDLLSTKGWTSTQPISLVLNKNISMEIPLTQTKLLQGEMQVMGKNYQLTAPLLSGIRLIAVDSQGRVYRTLTDQNGRYTFYLAPDIYEVSVETDEMPFTIENKIEKIDMKAAPDKYVLDFKYYDQRRKVDVKKF